MKDEGCAPRNVGASQLLAVREGCFVAARLAMTVHASLIMEAWHSSILINGLVIARSAATKQSSRVYSTGLFSFASYHWAFTQEQYSCKGKECKYGKEGQKETQMLIIINTHKRHEHHSG
jgi:hypothetical protein